MLQPAQPTPVSSAPPLQIGMQRIVHDSTVGAATGGASDSGRIAGISFSSNSSSSNDDSDKDMDEGSLSSETRKHKLSEYEGPSQKMMSFFEGLMKQVMERQEVMQQRFLETIEKRGQAKMIREEAWRRQEMARLSHELMAQEHAMAASRDAAVITFVQKIIGQNIQMQPATVAILAAPRRQTALPPPAAAAAPAQQQHHIHLAQPTQPTPPPHLQLQQQSQSLPQSQSNKIMPQQQRQSQSFEIVSHHPLS